MDKYNTFQDYFGLSNIAWKLEDLDKLVPQALCTSEEPDELSLCINLRDSVHDPLDVLRSDAHEDFLRNGIETDLDELDIYQSQLRERAVEVENPVLQEYLQSKRQKNKKSKKVCVFCKNNGELPEIYASHVLKDSTDGRTLCPVLRKYVCPLCGVSGDDAHTIRYCPKNDGNFSSVALLKTNRIATGKKRNTFKH